MAVDMAIDTSMARVAVRPIKIPSHVKARNPAAGITIAHPPNSLALNITSESLLKSLMISLPKAAYRTVNINAVIAPVLRSDFMASLIPLWSPAP